jgi:flagellar biosynthesis protein FliR
MSDALQAVLGVGMIVMMCYLPTIARHLSSISMELYELNRILKRFAEKGEE